jgi:hypothetical protein
LLVNPVCRHKVLPFSLAIVVILLKWHIIKLVLKIWIFQLVLKNYLWISEPYIILCQYPWWYIAIFREFARVSDGEGLPWCIAQYGSIYSVVQVIVVCEWRILTSWKGVGPDLHQFIDFSTWHLIVLKNEVC